VKNTEFKRYYDLLVAAHPSQFTTESMEELWFKKFGGKNLETFKKMVDILTEQDKFPSMAYAMGVYNRLANKGAQDQYRSKQNGIPDKIRNMSDEERALDYELLYGFMDAYPFPDYPVGATPGECQKIDADYYKLMKTAGIDPREATNPKVGKLLLQDILAIKPLKGLEGVLNPI